MAKMNEMPTISGQVQSAPISQAPSASVTSHPFIEGDRSKSKTPSVAGFGPSLIVGAITSNKSNKVLDISGSATAQSLQSDPKQSKNGSVMSIGLDQLRSSVRDIRMGSWAAFFDPKQFGVPESGGELADRVRANVAVFYPNYAVVSVILLAYCLFSSPLLLVGVVVFGVLMYAVLSRGQSVSLFGQTFNRNQQLIALSVCSVPLFLLLGLTGVFFWLIGASVCLTGLHSVFHQTPPQPSPPPPDSMANDGNVGGGDLKPEYQSAAVGGNFEVVML